MVRRALVRAGSVVAVLLVLVGGAVAAGARLTETVMVTYVGACSGQPDVLCAIDMQRGVVQWHANPPPLPVNQRRMVYSTGYPGVLRLFDGIEWRDVTDDDTHNLIPVLSDDGTLLVYARMDNESGEATLRLMTVQNYSYTTLPTPPGRPATPPIWSPDGNAFLYLTLLMNGSTQMWYVPVDGSKGVRLGVVSSNLVAWSPDGQQVAYVTPDKRRIFITEALSGTTVAEYGIAEGQNELSELAWSPDGDRIAFVYRHVPGNFPAGIPVHTTRLLHIPSGQITQFAHPPYQVSYTV
ncbi:MAG: hypothetical protein AAGK74_14015, partial [Chloroflexota bacterium]